MYDFSRAIAAFVDADGTAIALDQATPTDLADSVERMRHAIDWYVSGLGYSVVGLNDTDDWRKAWAANMSAAAERFLLAHEFGHVVLPPIHIDADLETRKRREFEADAFGLRLVLAENCKAEAAPATAFTYAGALLSVYVVELAEAYTGHEWSDTTHPHAGDRLLEMSMLAPLFGVSLEQVEVALFHVDGTMKQLCDRVVPFYWKNPDPDNVDKVRGYKNLIRVSDIVLAGVKGELRDEQVNHLIGKELYENPAVTVHVLRDIYKGSSPKDGIDLGKYVLEKLLPSLGLTGKVLAVM